MNNFNINSTFVLDEKKVLFAANHEFSFREPAMARGLIRLGWTVEYYSWKSAIRKKMIDQFNHRYVCGGVSRKINHDLVNAARRSEAKVVFLYKALHIWPSTIRMLRSFGMMVVTWNPDDAFGQYTWSFARRYASAQSRSLLKLIIAIDKYIAFRRMYHNYRACLPYIGYFLCLSV